MLSKLTAGSALASSFFQLIDARDETL